MATLEIEGRRVTVDDSFLSLSREEQEATVAEIAQSLKPAIAAPAKNYDGGAYSAATEGSHAGLMMGFDDEIAAGMLAPIDAAIDWAKGDGFDMGRAYSRKQQELDTRKDARREEHPVASLAGEVAGGMATGAGASRAGLTIAGKGATAAQKIGTMIAEAGAYGAATGAGEADPGKRGEGALWGGATGLAAGVLAPVAARALAPAGKYLDNIINGRPSGNVLPEAAKDTVASAASKETSKAMKAASGDLFEASEMSGVRFKPDSVTTLGKRLKLAAGKINDKLRPKTAGYADEIDQVFNGEMSLEDFEEFRQVLGAEMKSASENDRRTLGAMKRVLDNFAENAKSTDLMGDQNGIKLLRAAREKWSAAKKTEIIEGIVDLADIKSGRLTQSGMANAVRQQMEGLYKQIQSGKVRGFSDDEIDMIRRMATGKTDGVILRTLATFAPRGPVSITLGQIIGGVIPGGNFAVPIAGAAAGAARDRAAVEALEILLEKVSGGQAAATGIGRSATEISGRRAIPAASIGAVEAKEQLKQRPERSRQP